MKRRTLFQVLGGLFTGLGTRFEPARESIREVVARAKASFSPNARWRHVKPEPVVSRGDAGEQHGLKVAEVLSPARQRTRIGNDDDYLAAMFRADGVEVVKGSNVREVIDNNQVAMFESERFDIHRHIPELLDTWTKKV